jgi:predicted nucleic acid-binding protein
MLLLLDINIILDVVFNRPGEPASSALIASCGSQNQAWVAWHSVATLAYLIERERSPAVAREVVTGLLTWARVATTGHNDALQALHLPMADFEDALQVSAAQACGADYIITRNGRDFVKSPLPALSPEEFLARHAGG